MPIGYPSIRVDESNPRHHLWCNNGTWWMHYTIHFDCRKRRIRRSLRTRSLDVAIHRRDELLAELAGRGETVPARCMPRPAACVPMRPDATRDVLLIV